MSNPNRQPDGIPVGGQFAPSAKAASGVSLDEPAPRSSSAVSRYRLSLIDAELEPFLARRERAIARAIAEEVRDVRPEASRLVLSIGEDADARSYEVSAVLDRHGSDIGGEALSLSLDPGAVRLRALVRRIDIERKDHIDIDHSRPGWDGVATMDLSKCAELDLDEPRLMHEPMEALWFDPASIGDHFEEDEPDPLEGLTDDDLRNAGQMALQDDELYSAFGHSLRRAVDQVRDEKAASIGGAA